MRGINNTKDLFRPEYEYYIGAGYAAASISTFAMTGAMGVVPFSLTAIAAALSISWFKKAVPRIRHKCRLANNYFYFKDLAKFRSFNLDNQDRVFIGKGFEWGAEHASLYHRITSMSTDLNELNLPLIFQRGAKEDTETLGGKPYIHGIGDDEKEITVKASAFYGHTLIYGLPGTGKTTLLSMLSRGTLNRGSFNIIIDPKPDSDWEKSMREECEVMGVPFYLFSVANPSKSVRIDVLKDFESVTDIASRIMDVTRSKSNESDAFKDFAWKCINEVVQSMHYVGIPAQLTSVSRYLRYDYINLAEKSLDKFFSTHFSSQAEYDSVKKTMKSQNSTQSGDLMGMIEYYMSSSNVPDRNRVASVDNIINFVMHDKSHRDKMLASTDPLFAQLTASPLDVLLSPSLQNEMHDNTEATILNLEEMLDSGGCLYVALNSMGDSNMASNIAKLILSAISSVASRRYSREDGQGRRVSLYVDECHAAINDKVLNLLAVGRGAQFEIALSTQSSVDIVAKTDQATADRIMGLASNLFALRVSDKPTKDYVASNFDEASIDQYSYTKSDRAGGDSLLDSAAGFTESLGKETKEVFPPGALSNMPNLQCIARMQNGKKYKLRIPILTNAVKKKTLMQKLAGVA